MINHIAYSKDMIVTPDIILPNWPAFLDTPHQTSDKSAQTLSEQALETCLADKPELILIGYHGKAPLIPQPFLEHLIQQRIGLECMPFGAACRTFNVLLSEHRAVVLGLIFPKSI